MTTNPRGGAAEARNPEHYCTARRTDGDPCSNYALRGLTVCRFHGGSAPSSVNVRARSEIIELAEKQGLALPEVKPKDFPKIASQMISWNVTQYGQLAQELEALKAEGAAVAHTREFGDLLDRLDKWSVSITKLMNAVSSMGLDFSEKAQAPPADILKSALAGIRERISAGPNCHTCGQPKLHGEVVHGSVVTEPEPADEIAEALATLL